MKKIISLFLAFVAIGLQVTIFALHGENKQFNVWSDPNDSNLGYLNVISSQGDWTFDEVAERIAVIWSDESEDGDGILNRYVFRTTRKISDTLSIIGGYASDLFEVFAVVFPWDFVEECQPFDWSEV